METNQSMSASSENKPADVTNHESFASDLAGFNAVKRDIPFNVNSSEIVPDAGMPGIDSKNIDDYMKNSLIPALAKVIKVMPSGKIVLINGYASKTGSEQASKGFIGNLALSKNRAEAVLDYIIRNSDLDRSNFVINANGSSRPLGGTDPADPKNCRADLDIE